MHRDKLYIGLVSILISYASFIALPSPFIHFILGAFLMTGIICVCEYITRTLDNYSLVREVRSSRASFLKFVAATTTAAVILEGVFAWSLHLWSYPEWNTGAYALFFVPGFIAYWLVILESYLAARSFLRSCFSITSAMLIPVAIVVAVVCAGLVMEAQNIPAGLWRYSGWPLTFGQIGNVPVSVLLVWPVQYCIILLVLSVLDRTKRRALFE